MIMLERMLKLREAVDLFCQEDYKIDGQAISEIVINWTMVSRVIQLLEPIRDVTDQVR